MSQFTDTTVSPKRFKQLVTPDLNDNPFWDNLFDLLQWFRGDVRMVYYILNGSQTQNVTAGTSAFAFFEPPDANEEWEVLLLQCTDGAAIDAADIVSFSFGDNIIASLVHLKQDNLAADSALATTNTSQWPSTETGTKQQVNSSNLAPGSVILRKKDNATRWMYIQVKYTASATVGTRIVKFVLVYRRRPLA